MKKETLLAIAAAITAIANDLGDCSAAPVQTGEGTTTEPPKPRRGRPPTTEKPAETEGVKYDFEKKPEQPSQPEKTAEPTVTGKTYEELRAIIEQPVKDNLGAEVKKVIAKYAENLKDLATKPEHHAAFEKDIAAVVAAAAY